MQKIAEFHKKHNEKVVVSLSKFRGITYVDVRVYYQADDGEFKPTRKGVTLSPDLLKPLIDGLKKADHNLELRGSNDTKIRTIQKTRKKGKRDNATKAVVSDAASGVSGAE